MRSEKNPSHRPGLPSCGAWLLILAPLLALVARPLVTGDVFAFRDAAHYYYPQFAWEERQWRTGELPLWNPQDDLGVSVAADPTASLFYPGKLILHAPTALSFGLRFNLYVVLHLALAAAMTYGMARSWNLRRPAAALAAVSYACGGNVLFLYSNVVYLVGAAWLPAAFWAADRVVRRADWASVLGLAAALAMMTLGGDPQGALHAVLVGLLRVWCGGSAGDPAPDMNDSPPTPPPPLPCPASTLHEPRRGLSTMLIVGAAGAALAMSAVQSLPSWRASRESRRAAFDVPRSLTEVVAQTIDQAGVAETKNDDANEPDDLAQEPVAERVVSGLFSQPVAGTHHRQLYDFSVGPWRLVELLIPNVFGKMFPTHARWGFAIPAEGRIWTPSLFQGVAPIIFVIAGWLARRSASRHATSRWLSWTASLAILAGCGSYGLGWLVREVAGDVGVASPDWLGDPVGGLYWLLVTCVPSYVQFRYPAKWWTVAALALAALAARAFDRWLGRTGESPDAVGDSPVATDAARVQTSVARVSAVLFLLVSLALVALVIVHAAGAWHAWLAQMPADDWLGPFDADQAYRDTLFGMATALTFAGTTWGLSRLAMRPTSLAARGRLDWLLVGLTGVELVVAHSWLVVSAPRAAWDESRESFERLGERRFVRSRAAGGLPRDWRATSSSDRLIDTVRWDSRTLFSKLHLLGDAGSVDSPVATESFEYALLLEVARRSRRGDATTGLPPEIEELLAVAATIDAVAHAAGSPVEDIDLSRDELPPNPLRMHASPPARVRLVRNVERLPELTSRSPVDLRRRTREVLFPGDRARDWSREAVVEAGPNVELPGLVSDPPAAQRAGERDSIHRGEERASHVQVEVTLPSPALLVLADRYDLEWQVDVRDERGAPLAGARLLRTNRVLRGVWLPAGRWTVEFRYRPRTVYAGMAISAASWLAWLTLLIRSRRQPAASTS